MAMRLLQEDELHTKLKAAGLKETNEALSTSRLWDAGDGQFVWVPRREDGQYPDWILEDILRKVGRLYPNGNN